MGARHVAAHGMRDARSMPVYAPCGARVKAEADERIMACTAWRHRAIRLGGSETGSMVYWGQFSERVRSGSMARGPSLRHFLTNLDQPMPLPEKVGKLTRNLWRRVVLRQNCCGHDGEPGC